MPKKKDKTKNAKEEVVIKRPVGRPSDYTPELAHRICEVVATHPWGLKRLCAHYEWMPDYTTIHKWRWSIEEFSHQYTKAKIAQAELMAEDCVDIADDTSKDITYNAHGDEICNTEFVNRARLRVDTRKWLAAKLLPRIYGDLIKDADTDADELRVEMRELRKSLDEQNKKEY